MNEPASIAIVGAGPYGLSIAAHLRSCGVHFRIFGKTMHAWTAEMPSGMKLKSEGFASDISAPGGYTLKQFCANNDLAYRDFGYPIPLETFAKYGLSFQERLVPDVEDRTVERVERSECGFTLQLADGEIVTASSVVVAVGLNYFRYLPECFADLPAGYVSHSSEHADLSKFRGREVAVLGGGASATDTAALLDEHGARVHLIVRAADLSWLSEARPRPLWQRLMNPHTGLGFGWHFFAYMNAPWLFRYLPSKTRLRITRTALGPSGGPAIRDRVIGRMPIHLGQSLRSATVRDRRVVLSLVGNDGTERSVDADHVIAATGYEVDLERMNLLSDDLRSRLRRIGTAPELSGSFESSVPGLYFAGVAGLQSFGPLMRFVVGTGFVAPRLARHLRNVLARRQPANSGIATGLPWSEEVGRSEALPVISNRANG